MIGAIIGDIVGSRFEFNNYLKKDFNLMHPGSFFTDDSVCTVAVADWLMKSLELVSAPQPGPVLGWLGLLVVV